MQDAPTKETLLLALAKFIMMEVRPAVTDSRLSFRLLIAANLAGIVAQECAGEDAQNRAELTRLTAIFQDLDRDVADAARPEQLRVLAEFNARLARGIVDGSLDTAPGNAVFAHIKSTLIEKLAIDNPRFDAKRDLA